METSATLRAGVALGSNLGDRMANLRAAREQISDLAPVQPPLLSSGLYETEPVGCEPGAGPFLNAVIEFGFSEEAEQLLESLRDIERALGRPPAHPRNTSRTLDLDLLYLGEARIQSPALQLPHPRLHERRFVLEPLADIRPDLVLPTHAETVSVLLQRLAETPPLVRIASEW